ncbi:MAG: CapA family protein [Polyangiaceae bacterium]
MRAALFLGVVLTACAVAPSREPAPTPSEPASLPGRTRLSFGGDVYFGETYPGGPRQRYELPALPELGPLIVNFESVLAAPGSPSALTGRKRYIHASAPPTMDALAALGVVAVSLANNHAGDFGLPALLATRSAFAARGIVAFGAGESLDAADRPFVRDGVAVWGSYWRRPRYESYGAYAEDRRGGVSPLDVDRLAEAVRAAKAGDPGLFAVVFPHWGRNYRWRRDEQRHLAEALVDAGADLVLGHGAHVHQEIERHRGRWILYNLGNFLFHTPGRYAEAPEVPPRGLVVSLVQAPDEAWLELRFLDSDNQRTAYRPRLLDGSELEEALAALGARSCREDRDHFCREARLAPDRDWVRLPILGRVHK